MFFRVAQKKSRRFRAAWLFAALLLAAGSESALALPKPDRIITPVDLTATQARASQVNRPLLLLVAEPGSSRADDNARDALDSRGVRQETDGKALLAVVDLGVSQARATAARFHPLETPLLVCLSPRGMVLSRSQKPITKEVILEQLRRTIEESLETDRKFEALKKAADDSKSDSSAHLALADFLMERNNAFEAIPILTVIAHSGEIPAALRIRVWADLVRAHYWYR